MSSGSSGPCSDRTAHGKARANGEPARLTARGLEGCPGRSPGSRATTRRARPASARGPARRTPSAGSRADRRPSRTRSAGRRNRAGRESAQHVLRWRSARPAPTGRGTTSAAVRTRAVSARTPPFSESPARPQPPAVAAAALRGAVLRDPAPSARTASAGPPRSCRRPPASFLLGLLGSGLRQSADGRRREDVRLPRRRREPQDVLSLVRHARNVPPSGSPSTFAPERHPNALGCPQW